MDNDGVSGASRPKPTAAPDRAANPSVGAADSEQEQPAKRKHRKRDESAAAIPAPGFNLK